MSGARRQADQALAVPVEPVSRLDPTGFDPSRIRRHLLERYCDERCAEFGDVGCWAITPSDGFCADCIDDTDRAIEFVTAAIAIEARSDATAKQGAAEGESAANAQPLPPLSDSSTQSREIPDAL